MMNIAWDGQTHSYRPVDGWRERARQNLTFHDEVDQNLDPVTFEVIRSRLWTTNLAHGETLKRISGSPVYQAGDFNMSILTEDAEVVMNAPYAQFLNAGAPLGITYVLENFAGDPGIADGDIFLTNDPWIGAVHQMDVLLMMPVFVEGKLFAWVSNAGHQYDLGGVSAGGWPENAVDVFHDPVVIPPIKLIERGHLRRDLEAMYLRHSRFPGLVALDLRSQMAGVRFAAGELQSVVAEHGAGVVKAAMRRLIAGAQDSFRRKMRSIPDGCWQEVFYFDEKLPGDRGHQRVCLTIEKAGERLQVRNEGTQPQEQGPNGMTFAAFSGAVVGAITTIMMQDQLFPVGAVSRQVDFDVTPGLLNCVDHPAAVSGGILNTQATFNAAVAVMSRMTTASSEMASEGIAPDADFGLVVVAGADDSGRPFGTALLEQPNSLGATSTRDGIDHGGYLVAPLFRYMNVEEQEGFYPILILWRKRLVDSAGAGEWRGGGGICFGATEYRSSMFLVNTNTGAMGISGCGAHGLVGSLPSPTIEYRVLRDTDLLEKFKASSIPGSYEDLVAADNVILRGKSTGTLLSTGDVLAVRFPGAGGFGDPLRRDPSRVATDVADGWVSVDGAQHVYSVVCDDAGNVDREATKALRAEVIQQRLTWTAVANLLPGSTDVESIAATGEPPVAVTPYLEHADHDGERVLRCKICSTRISGYSDNYLRGLLVEERPVSWLPLVNDPISFLDSPIVLRCYCCANCGVQMSTAVVDSTEPHHPHVVLYANSSATGHAE